MSTEMTRELTRGLSAARDAGDVDAIGALLAEDVVFQPPASLGLSAITGREAVAGVLSGAIARLYLQPSTIRREVVRVVAEGDVSVVKGHLAGRTIADADYDNEYVWFYLWRDGLLARVEEHVDTLRAAQSDIAGLVQKAVAAQPPADSTKRNGEH